MMKLKSIVLILCFILKQGQAQDLSKSIFFGGGSYYVDDYQFQELKDFIDNIPFIHQYEIEIHGHTDDIGSFEYNEQLAKFRTRQVFLILEKIARIKREQIQIIDFGETNPVFDNATMEGKLRNRRVDIIIKRVSA